MQKTFQNKKRTCFNKMSFNLLYCKDMVKPYHIMCSEHLKNHLFAYVLQSNIYIVYKLLESFTKFTGKHLC